MKKVEILQNPRRALFSHLRVERFCRTFRHDQHLVPRVSLKAFFYSKSDVQPLNAVGTDPFFGFKYKLGELFKAECVVTVCTFPSDSERRVLNVGVKLFNCLWLQKSFCC